MPADPTLRLTDTPQIRTRPKTTGRRPLISLDDVVKSLELPFVFLVAWLLPSRLWGLVSRTYVKLRSTLNAPRHRRLREALAGTLPLEEGYPTSSEVAFDLEVNRYIQYAEVARDYRPGAGPLRTDLVGLPHLERALQGGAGAILLVGHFVHNGLAPKAALSKAGMPLVHLSRAEHGFSRTRFGIRFLNPIRRRREDRYLHARILFEYGSTVAAIRKLRRELASNGVVTITTGAWEGNRVMDVPLLGLSYPIATGAFALARSSGAPILPLIAIRDNRLRVTTVTIEEPLQAADAADRAGTIWMLGTEAVSRLEPYLRETPGQWRGWQYLRSTN